MPKIGGNLKTKRKRSTPLPPGQKKKFIKNGQNGLSMFGIIDTNKQSQQLGARSVATKSQPRVTQIGQKGQVRRSAREREGKGQVHYSQPQAPSPAQPPTQTSAPPQVIALRVDGTERPVGMPVVDFSHMGGLFQQQASVEGEAELSVRAEAQVVVEEELVVVIQNEGPNALFGMVAHEGAQAWSVQKMIPSGQCGEVKMEGSFTGYFELGVVPAS